MTLPVGFFTRQGNVYVPTGRGISPWNGKSISGNAIAGLLAYLVDRVPSPVPMHPARLTIDILGAVPNEPLTPEVTIVREGKRIQLIDVTLMAQGRIWARMSALRVRMTDTQPRDLAHAYPFPTGPIVPFESAMSETLRVGDGKVTPGAGARWARFPYPIIVGEPSAPLEMAAMIADFGGGISAHLPYAEWTFANLDISLNLTRLPRGEWLLVDAETLSSGNGVAIASSRLGDREGIFGISTQTVFLDRR